MRVSSAKDKGRRFQQKVVRLLRKAFHLENDDIQSRSMGAGGEDIMLSPAARKLIPYSFECKKHKSFLVYKYYEQAKTNSNGYEPCLVIEADRKKPLVVISLDHFIELINK